MKIEIAQYVAKCDICQRVKAVHMKTAGPLHSLIVHPGSGKIFVWTSSWDCPGHLQATIQYGLLLIV